MQLLLKYIGILIDKNLNTKAHIDLIALKISKTIGMIAKLRHFVPLSVIVKLYQSLVFPFLAYGISLWGQCERHSQHWISFLSFKSGLYVW